MSVDNLAIWGYSKYIWVEDEEEQAGGAIWPYLLSWVGHRNLLQCFPTDLSSIWLRQLV